MGAKTYMIDPSVAELSTGSAIGISLFTIVGGWIIYDFLCTRLVGNDTILA